MGESVKIIDLAKNLIKISGLSLRDDSNPEGDIAIEVTGLRPGEKLYEELLIGSEVVATPHPKIMTAKEVQLSSAEIEACLAELRAVIGGGRGDDVVTILKKTVDGYRPA